MVTFLIAVLLVASLVRHHSSGGTPFLHLRLNIGNEVGVACFIPALPSPERRRSLSLGPRLPLLSSSPLALPLPDHLPWEGGSSLPPRLLWYLPCPDLPDGRVPVPGHDVTGLSAFFSSAGWFSAAGCKKTARCRPTRTMQAPPFSHQMSLPRSRHMVLTHLTHGGRRWG